MSSIITNPELSNCRTLIDIFKFSVSAFPGNNLFSMKKNEKYEEMKYSEFGEMAESLAKALMSIGIKKGKKVGILSENRPMWGLAYFSIILTGSVVVPIDVQGSENELEHIINDSGIEVIFCSANVVDRLQEIHSLLKKLKTIVLFDRKKIKNKVFINDLIKKGRSIKKEKKIKTAPDDMAVLIYTSGTTGVSKAVMLSHWNITSNVIGVGGMIPIFEDDRFLSVLPLNHAFECTIGLILPVSKGSGITYAESLASKQIIADIRDRRITVMIGVPLLFEKMLTGLNRGISQKSLPVRTLFHTLMWTVKGINKTTGKEIGKKIFKSLRDKAGLGSLRLFVCGGAPLSRWIADAFNHLGIKFLQGYGLTETSPVLTVNIENDFDNSTVGYPFPNIELALESPDKEGIGELKARGDYVMLGYYKNRKATDAVLRNGWFYTGDLARFDNKGRIILEGRCKNLIVTPGGKNIFPEEIEDKLNRSPFIKESLVIGRKISIVNEGEETVAHIYPDYEYIDEIFGTSQQVTTQKIEETIKKEIRKYNSQTVQYKMIKDFILRQEEFPKTSTKKIKRFLFKTKDVHV